MPSMQNAGNGVGSAATRRYKSTTHAAGVFRIGGRSHSRSLLVMTRKISHVFVADQSVREVHYTAARNKKDVSYPHLLNHVLHDKICYAHNDHRNPSTKFFNRRMPSLIFAFSVA